MSETRNLGDVSAVEGRVSGTVMRYGAIGRNPVTGDLERFASGALRPHGDVRFDLDHEFGLVAASTERRSLRFDQQSDRLTMDAQVSPLVSRIIQAEDMFGLSVEFVALREHRDNGRVIDDALLKGVAATAKPAYPDALLELRRSSFSRVFRSSWRPRRKYSCECSGDECGYASFEPQALTDMANKINNSDVIAAWGRYDQPLASSSTGRLTAELADDGLDLSIALPDNDITERLVDASITTGIVARPFLSPDDIEAVSEVIDIDGDPVRRWSDGTSLRAVIVSATDAREGWEAPTITDVEPRSLSVVRRRLWTL